MILGKISMFVEDMLKIYLHLCWINFHLAWLKHNFGLVTSPSVGEKFPHSLLNLLGSSKRLSLRRCEGLGVDLLGNARTKWKPIYL